jgi:hypothetical protein
MRHVQCSEVSRRGAGYRARHKAAGRYEQGCQLMFNMFRKAQPRRPTAALCKALVSDGLPPGMEASSLSVVEQHGSYSGRRVTYFRAFDPIRVAERALQVRGYADLDVHPDLVLGYGHFETDGAVELSKRDRPPVASPPVRTEADRSTHGDDEQFVFPGRSS